MMGIPLDGHIEREREERVEAKAHQSNKSGEASAPSGVLLLPS